VKLTLLSVRLGQLALPLLLVFCVLDSGLAGQRDPLPYRLYIDVGHGNHAVSESVRRELELTVIDQLSQKRCFRSIARGVPDAPTDDDLFLAISIHDYKDETEHDLSIAARTAPNAPPDAERRLTTRVEVRVLVELSTAADRLPLRSKSFVQTGSWRPSAYEDAREMAREEMIDAAAKTIRSLLCKGTPRKWAAALESARADSGRD